MEKRTPHYNLTKIQVIVAEREALAFTRSALDNGRTMGLSIPEMAKVV